MFQDADKFLLSVHGAEEIARARKKSFFVRHKASMEVRKKYQPSRQVLGQGAFGVVLKFVTKEEPKTDVAVKIIRKERVNANQMQIMKDEIAIMSRFDHAHVIKHIESYEDENYVFMIMEALCDSVELQSIL